MANKSMRGAVQILTDRLYYVALKAHPSQDLCHITSTGQKKPIHFFNIDRELVYWNFFLDFGPLNLGQLYRFSTSLNKKLTQKQYADTTICFYSSIMPAKRANAIFLICSWQVLYLGREPEEAFSGFLPSNHSTTTATGEEMIVSDDEDDGEGCVPMENPQNCSVAPAKCSTGDATVCALPPFHDASPCACTYELNIMDCLRGLAKARMYGFFDFDEFDVEEYEHFEQVENGDLNWLIKDRILAFAGPHYKRNVSPEGYCTLTPEDYIPYFQSKEVDLVIRLNKKCYDEKLFIRAGINHLGQYYLDGSCPPMKILNRVVEQMEKVPANKAIAIHCKAGLGRTGTCIGAYIMKHYKFTAAEVIAWMRICRPGCVIGPQQHFMQAIEQRMWHEGSVMKMKPQQGINVSPIVGRSKSGTAIEEVKVNVVSPDDKKKSSFFSSLRFGALKVDQAFAEEEEKNEAVIGRKGQADGLLRRRAQTQYMQPAPSAQSSNWTKI